MLSYVLQQGRCRQCDAAIGIAPIAMELGCAGLALWAASIYSGDALWVASLLGWLLLALSICDFETLRLPDALTFGLLVIGLAVTGWSSPFDLAEHTVAAGAGYGILFTVGWAYRRYRGHDGLGGGDAKLMAAAGAWVGLAGLPTVLLISAMSGLMLALLLAVRNGWDAARHLPFGPCLAFGLWIVWLYG